MIACPYPFAVRKHSEKRQRNVRKKWLQNRMMCAVMDRFGRDVVVMKEDERHLGITVPLQ